MPLEKTAPQTYHGDMVAHRIAPPARRRLRPRPSRRAVTLLALIGVFTVFVATAGATTVARLSVTAGPEGSPGELPGPFAVLPGGDRVVLHVPASDGLLVLRGTELLQHLPVPPGFQVADLDASRKLIVAGAPTPHGRITIELAIFDVESGRLLGRVESANPFLKIASDSTKGWRVVAGESLAGVFHPPTAASYPLWDRNAGIVPSTDQVGRALAGIGFDDDTRWVPNPDGSVGRREHGRTDTVLEAGHGVFVGGLSDGTVFMRPDDGAKITNGRSVEVPLHAYRNGQAIGEVRLRVANARHGATRVPAEPVVRVAGDRLYWMFLGDDFLEVRTVDPAVTLSGEL